MAAMGGAVRAHRAGKGGGDRRRAQRRVAVVLLLLMLAATAATAAAFQSVGPCRMEGSPARAVGARTRGGRALGAAGMGGGADKERMKRLMQLKKIKETGGSYESLLNDEKAATTTAVLPQEQDYLDLLTGADGEGAGDRGEMDAEDQEMYAELRRQEKQALVDKILKAKNQAAAAKAAASTAAATAGGGGGGAGGPSVITAAPNKGMPSPYIQAKLDQRRQQEPVGGERFAKDVETYNPQSVSWGLYARPKNIPEAFGGQPIPEGGVTLDDKEWLKKYDDMLAEVREFKREAEGMVLTPLEKEDEPRILAARQQARQSMLRGEYEAAVTVLLPWRPKCSVRTQLGCQTLMDLAVAYEAVYDFDKAQEIYRLVTSSPVKELRTKAKALNLGAEAMRRMNLGSKSNVNPRNIVNFAYIPSQLEGSYGLYMKSRNPGGLDDDDLASRRAKIESVAQALEVLEDAVIAQGVGVRMDMVNAALRALHAEIMAADDRARGSGAAPLRPLPAEELEGRWRCRLTSHQESVDFLTKTDVWQRIENGGTVTGRLYTNPFEVVRDVKTAFSWESKARVLSYGAGDASFLGLPSGLPHSLRVLHLGETMMVTARCSDARGDTPRDAYEARFAVWTRAK